ncbi:MAG TPA: hypothetical protein VK116_11500, partial [Planctomycetota bacterium]|nr:hypothetical protein [Planctomycetota bacterium]
DRKRPDVARAWTRHLAEAIRRQDPDHLVTVGLVPWSLDRPGLTSGFLPSAIAPEVDFIAVHVYPERGKVDEALDTLRGFAVGKPVVIEETFPLKCGSEEHLEFLRRSREIAAGWIGFYWGATPDEYREMKDLRGALILGWLDTFDTFAKELREQEAGDRDPEAGTKSAAPAETPGE